MPRWARGAAGVRGRRCLPCGQRRCRVARRIMACRGRERGFRSGLPIREIYQRAGERGNGPHPAGDGDTRHLADRTRPSPGTRAQPQLSKTFPHLLRPFRAICGHSMPVYSLSAPTKVSFPPFPLPPHLPDHPAGRTAGSARTRPRVQTLEDPLWGTSARFPRLPVTKTPQADGPCSWAVRRVYALSPE